MKIILYSLTLILPTNKPHCLIKLKTSGRENTHGSCPSGTVGSLQRCHQIDPKVRIIQLPTDLIRRDLDDKGSSKIAK